MGHSKLSVIIPVHNGERTVGKAASQILGQDYRNLELILIENGSTDRTWDVCRVFARDDNRCIVLQSDVKSTLIARRIGIEHATGEYIAFCDADDGYRDDGSLGRLVAAAEKTDSDILQFGYIISRFGSKRINLGTSELHTIDRKQLLENEIAGVGGGFAQRITPSVWSKLYKSAVLKSITNELEPPLIKAEDLYLNSCAFFSEKTQAVSFVPISEYVYNVGIGGSSGGIQATENLFDEYNVLKIKVLELAALYGAGEHPQYLWHRESLRFLDALIRLYILRGDSQASTCEKIRMCWEYEFVQIARCYFRNYVLRNELDEEMLHFATEIDAERYYEYCVKRISNLGLERVWFKAKSVAKVVLRYAAGMV